MPAHFYSDASAFAGDGDGDILAAVRWVMNHLCVQRHKIKKKGCPSPMAWAMLCLYQRSQETMRDFIQTFGTRLMPTRSQLEREEGFRDDGIDPRETIDRLIGARNSVLPPGSKGRG